MKRLDLIDEEASRRFPRSTQYDPEWVLENSMGPNVMWFTESLTQAMDLRPGMRVLDLGCGKAVSSIFLAREFGVELWATDLWIPPHHNLAQIWSHAEWSDILERFYPIHAEARALPFQREFFDAIVSIDAYHYWGCDPAYLPYLAGFAKPGSQMGIVVPGRPDDAEPPLTPASDERFRPVRWWRELWDESGVVDIELAELISDGWRLWTRGDELKERLDHSKGQVSPHADGIRKVREDEGRTLGMIRIVARVRTR